MTDILMCGSRHWNEHNIAPMLQVILTLPEGTRVVSGGARGADTVAHVLADVDDVVTSVQVFADWNKYGRKAGPIRNRKMYNDHTIDAVFAYHDSIVQSKGTLDMVQYAMMKECSYVFIFDTNGKCYFKHRASEPIAWIEDELCPKLNYIGWDTCGNIYECADRTLITLDELAL